MCLEYIKEYVQNSIQANKLLQAWECSRLSTTECEMHNVDHEDLHRACNGAKAKGEKWKSFGKSGAISQKTKEHKHHDQN